MVIGRDTLVRAVARKLNMPVSRVKTVLITAEDMIVDNVSNNNEVQLTGFGTFKQKHCAPRLGRNPRNPTETFKVPAKTIPYFQPGKSFSEAVEDPECNNKRVN